MSAAPDGLPGQLPHDLPRLGISRAGDGARVDDAQVGRFVLVRLAIAVTREGLLDELRLVLVDLAAQGHQAARAELRRRFHGSPGRIR